MLMCAIEVFDMFVLLTKSMFVSKITEINNYF